VKRTAVVGVAVLVAVLASAAAAQDFNFSAKVADGGHPAGVAISNLGVTGAGRTLLVLDTNPAGVKAFPVANGIGSPVFSATDVGAPTSLVTFRDARTGLDDVAVLGASGIAVGTSNGGGGLTFRNLSFNGFDATDLAVGDFNADGLPDLVFVEAQEGQIGVALNNGANAFTGPVPIPVPGVTGIDLGVGRFDAGATTDLVVTTTKGFAILNGLGDGTFGLPLAFNLPSPPLSLAAADIDLDGLTDLAVGESAGVQVLENQTSPGQVEVFSGQFLKVGTGPVGIVELDDLNNDNVLDVIALNRGSGNVSTFIASPNSGYNAHSTALAGLNPISIALGRLNGDAFDDLAVVGDGEIGVFDGTGGKGETPGGGKSLPFVPTPNGPGTGHKQTPPTRISPPKCAQAAGATCSSTEFWDINVPLKKKPIACGLFDSKTKRQIKNPLFAGVTQKLSCTSTNRTRVVHGEKKRIVRVELTLSSEKSAKGSATVWAEVFWK